MREPELCRHYLIAQPHADAPCYHISDYIRKCVAGDLKIAERLRGRTLITLYQTEASAADLLSDSGTSAFVEHVLKGYLETYGKRNLIGFSCELPKFLSMLHVLGNRSVVGSLESSTVGNDGRDRLRLFAVGPL